MTDHQRAGVTPAGIRDGRPEVLRALVDARGAAVLAYCRTVCDVADAGRATAEAFARFRAAVVDSADVSAIDPDALLLGATRHAAASLAHRRTEDPACAGVPRLLAVRAAGLLSDDEAMQLDVHLADCPSCRVLAEDFGHAEDAYRAATSVPIAGAMERMVLAALQTAAPVRDEREADPSVAAPSTQEPEIISAGDTGCSKSDPLPPVLDHREGEADAQADIDPEPSPDDEERPHDVFYDGPIYPEDDEEQGAALVPQPPDDAEDRPRVRLARPVVPSLPRPHLPRRERGSRWAGALTGSQRRDLRPLVLPTVVVLAALVVFLAASGVFGGEDPEPPKAERQPIELRVERPVTTPLPVEPAPDPVPETVPDAPDTEGTAPVAPPAETTPAPTEQPEAPADGGAPAGPEGDAGGSGGTAGTADENSAATGGEDPAAAP